jgi:hypothetical protein
LVGGCEHKVVIHYWMRIQRTTIIACTLVGKGRFASPIGVLRTSKKKKDQSSPKKNNGNTNRTSNMKMTFPSQLLISRLDSEGSSDSDKSLARSMYTPHVAATKQSRQEISDLSASHPPKSRGFVSGPLLRRPTRKRRGINAQGPDRLHAFPILVR